LNNVQLQCVTLLSSPLHILGLHARPPPNFVGASDRLVKLQRVSPRSLLLECIEAGKFGLVMEIMAVALSEISAELAPYQLSYKFRA